MAPRLQDLVSIKGFSAAMSSMTQYSLDRRGEARIFCGYLPGKPYFEVDYGTPTTMRFQYAPTKFFDTNGNPLPNEPKNVGKMVLDIHTHSLDCDMHRLGFSVADLGCAMSNYAENKESVFGVTQALSPSEARMLLWRPSDRISEEIESMGEALEEYPEDILPRQEEYCSYPDRNRMSNVVEEIKEEHAMMRASGIYITDAELERGTPETMTFQGFEAVNGEDAESLLNSFGTAAIVNFMMQNGIWSPVPGPESGDKLKRFNFRKKYK